MPYQPVRETLGRHGRKLQRLLPEFPDPARNRPLLRPFERWVRWRDDLGRIPQLVVLTRRPHATVETRLVIVSRRDSDAAALVKDPTAGCAVELVPEVAREPREVGAEVVEGGPEGRALVPRGIVTPEDVIHTHPERTIVCDSCPQVLRASSGPVWPHRHPTSLIPAHTEELVRRGVGLVGEGEGVVDGANPPDRGPRWTVGRSWRVLIAAQVQQAV